MPAPSVHDAGSAQNVGGTSNTLSLTTTAGVAAVVACVQSYTDGGTISGVTWNGSAMTQAVALGGNRQARIYYALDSTPRTANVVASFGSSINSRLTVFSLRAVKPTDPVRVTGTHTEGAWAPANAETHGPTIASDPLDLVISQAHTNNAEGGDVAYAGDLNAYINSAYGAIRVARGPGDSSFQAWWTQDSTPDADGQSWIVAAAFTGISAGSRAWIMAARRWQEFLKDLKHGLVSPDVLRRRYKGLVAI